MGAADVAGRLLASIFRSGPIAPSFSNCLDVPYGGVLLGLPGLLSMGLLRHAKKFFQLPRGFYGMASIFLLLAFMALARFKSIESLRYSSPGEWGKLLGLDRAPEVRTLREKVNILTQRGQPIDWAAELSRDWMGMFPESTGVLYVDGHVRVYNGRQTELPRHYVARQKLCLRATTDYWVNAMDGQPFFMVNKPVDPGLLCVLENEIIPRLEEDIPCQPNREDLERDPFLPRFTIVFDREGYSPGFMVRAWEKRIACLTYNKYPGEDWPESAFDEQEVCLVSGLVVKMKLAEREVLFKGKINGREIRKLTRSGHQTSIISTDFKRKTAPLAAAMFARWYQENFFKYMRENYGLDRLIDYSTEEISESTPVVNPLYREADGDVRKLAARIGRKRCECSEVILCDDIEPDKVVEYETKKSAILEDIRLMEKDLEELKDCRKALPKHVKLGDLPEEDQFRQLGARSKNFIDTIKMIAYRAETAMVNIVRQTMSHTDEARKLVSSLYATAADIKPDQEAETLTVWLHQPANRSSAITIEKLCDELNETNVTFPGTNLRLIYKLIT